MVKMRPMKSMLIAVLIPFKLSENGLELWMQTRKEEGPLNGFLEFPGGKVEGGESFKDASIREFKEEVTADENCLSQVLPFKNYSYTYPDRTVTLFTFLGQVNSDELSKEGWHKINFNDPLLGLKDKILSANIELIEDLSRYFQEILEDGSWSELWPPL